MKIFELSYLSQLKEGRVIQGQGDDSFGYDLPSAIAKASARVLLDTFKTPRGTVIPYAETETRTTFKQNAIDNLDYAEAYSFASSGGLYVPDESL